MRRLVLLLALVVVPAAHAQDLVQRSNVPGLTPQQYADAFIKRDGSRLTVAGQPFRFTGPNIEWLGLKNYGPIASDSIPVNSEAFPSKYEIDDALATAHELGATVVRAQTIGDTTGCSKCFEPQLGQFNEEALKHFDLVVAEARRYGLKLWGEFEGDAGGTGVSGGLSDDWFCTWRHVANCGTSFFSDPQLLADFERHMDALLNHVNTITGVAYKDDPTFAGFVDGNNLGLLEGTPPWDLEAWLRKVSDHFKSVDKHHLFLDISLTGGDLNASGTALQIPGVDIHGQEYYPRTVPLVQGGTKIEGSALLMHEEAARIARAGKVFAEIEYGWDHTNFLSTGAFQQYLDGLRDDPNIGGDGFWALMSHADGHGWQQIPANAECKPTCQLIGEDGNWWAVYYTGVDTLSNSAAEMGGRAQMLRRLAYARDGFTTTPPHEQVPAPIITSTDNGKVVFEGSAGAPTYSVERWNGAAWTRLCTACTTDADGGYDTKAPGCFRVIGQNLDGVLGPPSAPAGSGCPSGTHRASRQVRRRARRRHPARTAGPRR